MSGRSRGRVSLRDQVAANQRAMDAYAKLTGKPRVVLEVPAEPKPRAPRTPSAGPTEAQVQKAVLAFLKRHPAVAQVWRQNSGTFRETNRDGSHRYIRANTARGMSDLMGVLRDGRTLAVEVKSPSGRVRPEQQQFLDTIRAAGGVAGVVRSVDDAIALVGPA